MDSSTKKKLVTLCDDGWLCKACPEVFLDEAAKPAQQISITDDFGNTVQMSKAQFGVLVEQSKDGKFNI